MADLKSSKDQVSAVVTRDSKCEEEAIIRKAAETEVAEAACDVPDRCFGKKGTVVTTTLTRATDTEYSMQHGRRGDCLIFVHSNYSTANMARDSVQHDTCLCQQAFQKLGFEVQIFKDCTKKKFNEVLHEASARDHSACDAFVVVFMSHGDLFDGKEVLCLYDGDVETSKLWKHFSSDKCPTLAGKPKLFFIQACRGEKTDPGIGLRVCTDGPKKQTEPDYTLPCYADILVMWASHLGMFAFRTERDGKKVSVFIHYLVKTLMNEGFNLPLSELLLQVSRAVAVEYTVSTTDEVQNNTKQSPSTTSTLLRTLRFPPLARS